MTALKVTYVEAHNATNTKGGAYIANILPSSSFKTEISLGSGFVEVMVERDELDENNSISIFVDLFPNQSPKAPKEIPDENTDQMLMVITYLLAGLIILVITLFFLLCLLHRYQKEHIVKGNEVVSLTDSAFIVSWHHHQHRSLNTVSKPPDLRIQRDNLPQAGRHKDSDYGFQHEF